MKIALLGYGKMGQAIEKIAVRRGHEIVLRKAIGDTFEGLEKADVAIDFSAPDSAVDHISECLNRGIPVVSGTTGWLDHYQEMTQLCQEKNGTFIYGSNFSLGVNLFFLLNEKLAEMMSRFPEYKVELEEIHHTQKLDAPSGTAISLADQIIGNTDYTSWQLGQTDNEVIGIEAKRIENVPGTHSVFYKSAIDEIEIKHTAHSREGFAQGAVMAAEWILGKKGIFTMKDVLGL
ncbi:MAG: 4-hydroxy-tetrahydrodipicolinate reductase [Flavobacteriaceae bacterium]